MKRKTKVWINRITAVFMAVMVVFMSFFPIITFAEGNFKPGNFSPGNFTPGNFTPGNFTPGNFSPGEFTPGDFQPEEFSPGEFAPGDFQPGTFSPGEFNPGDFVPGEGATPGQYTPGQTTPGNFTEGTPGTNPDGQNRNPTPSTTNPSTIENPSYDTNAPTTGSGETDQNQGDSSSEGTKKYPFSDDPAYQGLKFITNSMIFPAIKGLDKHTLIDIDWNRYEENLSKSVAKSLIKNQLGNMFDGNTLYGGLGKLGLDIWSGVDNAKHISGFFNSWTDIKSIWNTATTTGGSFSGAALGSGSFFSKITKPFDMGTGIAGKAAPWMAAISTGISGAETIMNFANGDTVDGFASLGETLMSGAVVLSATGVGAPIAAGVAIAGGVLWAGAKIVKHKDTVVKAVKAVGNGIANTAKAVGNVVKGGVDVVKSGFKKIAGWFG